jgi:ATP adenylyltransferase/5',5'''-P-1,P-4-tetraphosphate phosphorylase II
LRNQHLYFNTSIGVQKPESIRNKETPCPFCARDQLTDILAVEGTIIFLKNKYPVLENAYQTVLIETDDCQAELSTYPKEHLHKLLKFGLKYWEEMENSGIYESVIFFKNYGPFSGGTIAHPHMQIIGLHDLDYRDNLEEEAFKGIVIREENGVRFSLSTLPRIGFYEFNVQMKEEAGYTKEFGEYIQTAAHYILHHFPFKSTSYNIFFYHLNENIYAKIVPRFVTTPIYIGYGLPQVPNNLDWMANQVNQIYFYKGDEGILG